VRPGRPDILIAFSFLFLPKPSRSSLRDIYPEKSVAVSGYVQPGLLEGLVRTALFRETRGRRGGLERDSRDSACRRRKLRPAVVLKTHAWHCGRAIPPPPKNFELWPGPGRWSPRDAARRHVAIVVLDSDGSARLYQVLNRSHLRGAGAFRGNRRQGGTRDSVG